jgi:hypothetical protein
MGVELHITRAELWAENDHAPITAEEWLAYVASDPELRPWPENGPYFVRWAGPSKYEEPWLDWFQGNVSTKWPDTALYRKMLQVAQALNAQVQDDDGTPYRKEADWEFDPTQPPKSAEPKRKTSWWRRFLRE